jgi:hypothetical protein
MRHSAFRAAVERGAVPILMPRLFPSKEIEDRRVSFGMASQGRMPEGRQGVPLGAFDQARTRHWLAAMEEAFAPIATWLP